MGSVFQVVGNDGDPLDAHFEVDGPAVIFHSRGGSKDKQPRNSDYSTALRLLLERVANSGIQVEAAWVDSSRVQHIPLGQRAILEKGDFQRGTLEALRLMTARMKSIGRDAGAVAGATPPSESASSWKRRSREAVSFRRWVEPLPRRTSEAWIDCLRSNCRESRRSTYGKRFRRYGKDTPTTVSDHQRTLT